MLTATPMMADIIFIVDETNSMTGTLGSPQSNEILKSLTADDGVIVKLNETLGAKGVDDVRYGLVAYGGEFSSTAPVDPLFQEVDENGSLLGSEPRPIKLTSDPVNPYFVSGPTAVQDLRDAMTPKDAGLFDPLEGLVFNNGDTEDSWEAVAFVFNAHIDNDPAKGLIYDFRPNAAVHFVLITDDGRARRAGESPVLPAELPGETNLDGVVNLATLLDQLDRQSNDRTDDIGLTAFIPVNFQPEDTTLTGPILAVDMNKFTGFLSHWDVDLDDSPPPMPGPPDYLAFHAEDTTGDGRYDTIQETHVEGDMVDAVVTPPDPPLTFNFYADVKSELSCDPDCEYTRSSGSSGFIFERDIVDQGQIAQLLVGRDNYSEENAFLAWETGGAVWNSAYLDDTYFVGPDLPATTDELVVLLEGGLVDDIVNRIVPPHVEAVIIGTTLGDDPPYSIQTINTETDALLSTLAGEQMRTVPVGRANQISIQFSEDVDGVFVDRFHMELNGVFGDDVDFNETVMPGTVDFNYDAASRTATWAFTNLATPGNAFPADQYVITVRDAATDSVRVPLDGNWTNPPTIWDDADVGSDFPSGNGVKGQEFSFHFTILPGDANRDNVVGRWDALNISAENDPLVDSTFQQGDFNGDGDVTEVADYDDLLRANAHKVFVAWGMVMKVGDMDIDLDVDFDDIDGYVEALNTIDNAISTYIDNHRGSFNGLDDDTIRKIVKQAIGDVDDDGDMDFDDLSFFVSLLSSIDNVIPVNLSS